eukprot:3971113-Ditylum_brightwellii.AAC.1
MVLDGVNLIDNDDVSDRDIVMEPVDLDLDTDDDHGVQENSEPIISGDDDSDKISLFWQTILLNLHINMMYFLPLAMNKVRRMHYVLFQHLLK